MPSANIWIAASDGDIVSVGQFIAADPTIVNRKDENGYTPLHAAASYNHVSLLRSLVRSHGGNVNLSDDDGDTPLFVAETVETARCLVEELGADVAHRNHAGLTAAESIEDDGQLPLVAAYLREKMPATAADGENGVLSSTPTPPPPENVQVSYTTMDLAEDLSLPVDDELRRRIDELAQRGDFESEETQRELRELITGVMRDHVTELDAQRNVRPRQDEQ